MLDGQILPTAVKTLYSILLIPVARHDDTPAVHLHGFGKTAFPVHATKAFKSVTGRVV